MNYKLGNSTSFGCTPL